MIFIHKRSCPNCGAEAFLESISVVPYDGRSNWICRNGHHTNVVANVRPLTDLPEALRQIGVLETS